jgi:putative aldouronate transport system permease protein
MTYDRTWGSRLFDAVNYILLSLISLATVLPFLYVLAVSFASPKQVHAGGLLLFPKEWSLSAYRYIFSTNALTHSMLVSIYITVVGTAINLLFTSLMAYPLAKKSLMGRSPILLMVLFTMLFSGGMIPTYFVVKALGMVDTLWALMIPGAVSAFNLIVMKNFFQQLPEELIDSATVDGYNDIQILFRIVIPLSLPAMATFTLFYAVEHWNQFFAAVIYLNDTKKWPIQVLLRSIVIMSQDAVGNNASQDPVEYAPLTIQMAVVVFATVPILLVYPFLQKHFTKGVLLGSVKG